jgi:toxin ParE1/3/4
VTGKPVFLFPQAELDIREAIRHYQQEGGVNLAGKWVEAVESGLRHIGTHPGTGSSRYAMVLKLVGLRFWPVKRFPQLIFYVEREGQVDVWRVLHGQQDLPEWIREPLP